MNLTDIQKAAEDSRITCASTMTPGGISLEDPSCPMSRDEIAETFFVNGARWRINSVWHTDLKKAKRHKPVLVKFKNGLFNLFEDIGELEIIKDKVLSFAYLQDLTLE